MGHIIKIIMMDKRFEAFFLKLMEYEGGLANDADDSGGLTKFGISQKAYPDINIPLLTIERAKAIYWMDYYQPLNIPAIVDDRIAWQIFDFGVNAGVKESAKTIQKIVGANCDGEIGPKTLNLINLFEDEYPLYIHFISERLKHYLLITDRKPKQIKFLKGWMLRTLEL
jgi:lysozyme family protein